MKPFLTFFFAILMAACNQRPKMTLPDGRVVDLGFSVATKSSTETASYTSPGGEALNWSSNDRDETVVPVKVTNGYTQLGLGRLAVDAFRTSEGTTRALAREETARNATNKAAASTDLKTLNPVVVPEGPSPVVPVAAPAAASP